MIYPKLYLNKVEDITVEILSENKIKALILDVDNTLIDINKNLSKEIIDWAMNLRGHGFRLYILSNTNHKEKVEGVAKKLGIPYENFAKKPFKSGFLRVKEKLQLESKQIAVVGDQIFTDVIGGNRCDMYTILVDPISEKDYWYTAWKRPIENAIKKKYVNKIKESQ